MPAMVAPRKTSSAARRDDVAPPPSAAFDLRSAAAGGGATFSSRILQLSIRLQLAHRVRFVATFLIQPGEVVVRVGILRIDGDGALVRVDRIRRSSEIFERDAEVE